MPLTLLPVSLIFAGALALVNLWLTWRVGQVRRSEKVSVGDGGNERVTRRMRAHANFAENAPFVVVLVALIEFSRGTSLWLWAAAILFLLARIAHGLGMDEWRPGRMIGTLATLAITLALAGWAIAIPLVGSPSAPSGKGYEMVVPKG